MKQKKVQGAKLWYPNVSRGKFFPVLYADISCIPNRKRYLLRATRSESQQICDDLNEKIQKEVTKITNKTLISLQNLGKKYDLGSVSLIKGSIKHLKKYVWG